MKPILQLECIVNGITARMLLENDTPIVVAKEMIFQFQKMIAQIEDNIKAQQEEKTEGEKTSDSAVDEKIEQIG